MKFVLGVQIFNNTGVYFKAARLNSYYAHVIINSNYSQFAGLVMAQTSEGIRFNFWSNDGSSSYGNFTMTKIENYHLRFMNSEGRHAIGPIAVICTNAINQIYGTDD